ncbi:lytic transglycosylase domain-containing protein [Thermomonas sp. HDW16]|uniref:lytic transglycosylase domain-containing protein n=1 Tax=Thermomonas sp. HDW16 TaxID=2714945 RepID=UPI001409E6C4|nr:lytic transglycosylase domain-containing protein [Thermomonas sp. HDW16]QIL19676.1 lytic transglycosylase domain-containing protein [Thermomonas sp. HDW16]
MHKSTLSMLTVLLANLCASSSACAQTPAPAVQSANPPVRIATPNDALRAAFDAAARGTLDASALPAYAGQPLAGWLEYATLRRDFAILPTERGGTFLAKYRGTPVAQAFRNEWLAALAKRNDAAAFLSAWDDGIDDPSLRCARANAQLQLGRTDGHWAHEVQALWRSSGTSLPDACDAPFAQLATQGGLDGTLRWERFDKAAAETQSGVIRAIARGMEADDAVLANAYAAYIDAPSSGVDAWPKTPRSRLVASYALAKLAKNSPDRAEAMLPGIASTLGFNEEERGRVLYPIALWTVASYLPDSARRLTAVPLSAYDASLHEWQVREALSRSDWAAALAAIRRMPDAQRNDSRWTYFAARTSELTGDAAGAKALYRQAALKPDFHGFLAADKLEQPYALCPWQPAVTPAAKQAIARDPAIVRALQLFALDRKGWAEREWKDALSRYSDEQRRIAVEVAQDNGWFDRGVFGLVNVDGKRYPEETRLYQLRFPLHHDATIRREASRNNLDPAWIAAEIRAESVFDPNARSSADARGLMQVLPGTGAGVAAKLDIPWAGGQSLYNADTNIVLGSAYLRQLMDKYGGKPYQVIAGYNAGPAPLGRWIGQRPTMDPDFWIETISYKETREYVARVLSFSTVYDWRLNGDALRLSERMLGRSAGPRKAFVCPTPEPAKPVVTASPAKPTMKERRRK